MTVDARREPRHRRRHRSTPPQAGYISHSHAKRVVRAGAHGEPARRTDSWGELWVRKGLAALRPLTPSSSLVADYGWLSRVVAIGIAHRRADGPVFLQETEIAWKRILLSPC